MDQLPDRLPQPAKGPYSAACKLGSYRCPLCYTEWSLNQPYGRHIIGQACQVRHVIYKTRSIRHFFFQHWVKDMRNWTHTKDAGNKGHRKKRKTRPTGLIVTNASIRQVELPGPVKKKGEEDDEAKILRYVTVTPATAKRDSSVRMGKVPLDAQIRCGFLVFSQFSPLNSNGDTPRPTMHFAYCKIPTLSIQSLPLKVV